MYNDIRIYKELLGDFCQAPNLSEFKYFQKTTIDSTIDLEGEKYGHFKVSTSLILALSWNRAKDSQRDDFR